MTLDRCALIPRKTNARMIAHARIVAVSPCLTTLLHVPKVFATFSEKSKLLGQIWDGLGMILGWFGGLFGTISDRVRKVENLRARN